MKKLFGTFMIGASVLTLASCGEDDPVYDRCGGDAATNFEAEKATLTNPSEVVTVDVLVDNDMGPALVTAFNDHAEAEGINVRITTTKGDASGSAEQVATQQADFHDVVLLIDGEVIGREQHFVNIGEVLGEDVLMDLNTYSAERVNCTQAGFVYAPAYYDGMAFAYNNSMMETILGSGYAVNSETNLPEAFDTWEEILAYSNALSNDGTDITAKAWDGTTAGANTSLKLKEIFPVGVNELWSAYPMYSTQGFDVFADEDALDPGFDSDEYKAGLEFYKTMADNKISPFKAGVDMGWRWDSNNTTDYLFTQIGTWMDVDSMETGGEDVKLAQFPTYKGEAGKAFGKTKGWGINNYSANKEAAKYVVEWLYTKAGFQTVVDNSGYFDTNEEDATFTPEYTDQNKLEFKTAVKNNVSEPLLTLPTPYKTTEAAMGGWFNDAYKPLIIELWDGDKTVDETLTAIKSAHSTWLEGKKA